MTNESEDSRTTNFSMRSDPIQSLLDSIVEGWQVGILWSIIKLVREEHETGQLDVRNVADVFTVHARRTIEGRS